jgi:NAD(P)-dependent dehydrogenase (short-subunit alcohol dehydrogenase family)
MKYAHQEMSNMRSLLDKVAFITGSGSGIGRDSAILFAEQGAKVVVAEISDAAGEQTAAMIRESGGDAIFLHVDVGDEASVQQAIATTVERYGKLDIIYNNAGGSSPKDGTVTDMDTAEFWRTMRVDLFGTFLCCRFGIPELIKAGGGTIVNTTSTTALRGVPRMEAYTAAKGGIISLTQAMAIDYAEYGIRVNAIAPGGIRTERTARNIASLSHAAATQGAHLLGIGTPKDVADTALFLASEQSRYITGAVLIVDGGWCAASPGVQAKPRYNPNAKV